MTPWKRVEPTQAVQPALTAKEWENKRYYAESGTGEMIVNMGKWNGTGFMAHSSIPEHGRSADRHAAAALCLHEQPFGFTREDVDDLKDIIALLGFKDLEDLVARIEALLPPEDVTP